MHSSITVANKILELAQEKNNTITPMQLMKLVFLCHGWMLGLHSRHLIKDPIEAWRYGPVIKCLYDSIKEFKSNPVTYPLHSEEQEQLDKQEIELIKQVYQEYGHYSGIELSSLTHDKNSPWDRTWSRYGQNALISNDLIEDYYKNLARQKNV